MQSHPPGVRDQVRKIVQDVLSWQKRMEVHRIPYQHAEDEEERKLGHRFKMVLLRRFKDYGPEMSRSKLSPTEKDLVNSVAGVPLHGCSAAVKENLATLTKDADVTTSHGSLPATGPVWYDRRFFPGMPVFVVRRSWM